MLNPMVYLTVEPKESANRGRTCGKLNKEQHQGRGQFMAKGERQKYQKQKDNRNNNGAGV